MFPAALAVETSPAPFSAGLKDGVCYSFHPAAAELGIRGARGGKGCTGEGGAVGSVRPGHAPVTHPPSCTSGAEASGAEIPLISRDPALSPEPPTLDPSSPGHARLHLQPLALSWLGSHSGLGFT